MNEQQFNKIWDLHKVGNPEITKSILEYQINQQVIYNNILVDYDYLLKKYSEYKKWWNSLYGSRDAKYVGKDNEFKTLYDFIKGNYFQQDYEIDKNNIDYYLAITLVNKKELEQELNNFLNT